MVICPLYCKGTCSMGFKCPNEHIDIQNIFKTDVESAIKGKIWPLSSYGPFEYKPSISGFIEDRSFEEVRMSFYVSKDKKVYQQFNDEVFEAYTKMNTLLKMTPDFINAAISVYNIPADTTCYGVFGLFNSQQQKYKQIAKPNNFTFRSGSSSDSNLGDSPFGGQQQKVQTAKLANFTSSQQKQPQNSNTPTQIAEISVTPPNNILTIDKYITDLVLVDMLPYNIVEGLAFSRHAEKVYGRPLIMPTKEYVRTILMPRNFKDIEEKVLAKLKAVERISVTTHLCTTPDSSFSLLVFIAHYLREYTRDFLILGTNILEKDYKDADIANKMRETIAKFNLEDKLYFHIHRNPKTTEEETLNFGQVKSMECVAAILEKIMDDVILQKQNIKEIIEKCQIIKTKMYSNNWLKPQNALNLKSKWIDSYSLIKHLVKSNLMDCILSDHNILTPEEWSLLYDIDYMLNLFHVALKDLTTKTANISLIIPIIHFLKNKLNDFKEDDLVNELKQALNNKFKFIEDSTFLMAATLLDPRLKGQYLKDIQIHMATNEIIRYLNEHDSTENTNPPQLSEEKTKNNDELNTTLWDKHDKNFPIQNELRLYIIKPLEPRTTNIVEYWLKSNDTNLRKYSLNYLTAPPTVLAYDNFINTGAFLYNERSIHFKNFDAEQFLFCHYNKKIFDYNC